MESGAKQLSDRSGVLSSGASGQMRELEDGQLGEGWMVELSSGNWKTDSGVGGQEGRRWMVEMGAHIWSGGG